MSQQQSWATRLDNFITGLSNLTPADKQRAFSILTARNACEARLGLCGFGSCDHAERSWR